ncbi:MAG: polysaccharide deacetylase family protein [bacterium]
MWTFKRLTIVFFVFLFILNLLRFIACNYQWITPYFCDYSALFQIILVALYIGISVTLAFFIQSQFHHKALCCSATNEPICALTFDDGPHSTFTQEVLNVLNRNNIQASFFCIGENLAKNKELLKEMHTQGHLIGNHSWSHSAWFDFFPSRRIRKELIKTSGEIREITGKDPLLFRPPYGVLNPMVSSALKSLNYHVIGWNIRAFDTLVQNPDRIASGIVRKIRPGSIIVLHDHLAQTGAALKKLIPALQLKGYRFVSLTSLLNIDAYA